MPDRYAVIGNPVAHSKSPQIHAAFAEQTSQELNYGRLLAPLDGFTASVDRFRGEGGRGLNVTVPFKADAYRYADRLSERGRAAQAVNTLKFDNGGCFGDNTDGAGLVSDITRNLGIPICGRSVLLLGAGGAARGVILPLLDQKPSQLVVANRSPDKALQLAQHFDAALTALSYPELANRRFDIVVNATSASLSGSLPPLPKGVFASGGVAYDMMYGKTGLPFLEFARTEGASIISDGLGMLVEQAAESFFVWRGVRPDTAAVLRMLRNT